MPTFDRAMDRRDLLRGRWHAVAEAEAKVDGGPPVIRPPGSLAPGRFENLCDGCGDCAEACPADAIRMDAAGTAAASRTPQIVATDSPCVMCDGLVCAPACPTGALEPVTPATMRVAVLVFHADACLARTGIDPGCDYCFDRSPLRGKAVTYRRGTGPEFYADQCTGCGSCVHFCPANPKALSLAAL